MMRSLRQMIESASRVTEAIFAGTGQILPMWHVIDRDGKEHLVPPPPVDKDLSSVILRELFEKIGATRCLLIDEAWSAEISKDDPIPEELEHHPGRTEVIFFQAEDVHEGQLVGRRLIIREGGKARLGPLEIERPEITEGRFVGMLPLRGKPS